MIQLCFGVIVRVVCIALNFHCDHFHPQGEIGEPGQKGSKGDKGEHVSYLFILDCEINPISYLNIQYMTPILFYPIFRVHLVLLALKVQLEHLALL